MSPTSDLIGSRVSRDITSYDNYSQDAQEQIRFQVSHMSPYLNELLWILSFMIFKNSKISWFNAFMGLISIKQNKLKIITIFS